MKQVVIFGETMIEFHETNTGEYKRSFSGDVHSFAVYLKRAVGDLVNCHLLSCIGKDQNSLDLRTVLKSQNLSDDFLLPHPHKKMGLYLINTDQDGERTFDYWRENSAARDTIRLGINSFKQSIFEIKPDIFFFSGISVAITPEKDRPQLWLFIKELKELGAKIVFDPNHRPALWQDQDMIEDYSQAISLSDIILPSLEDMQSLYSTGDIYDTIDFLRGFGADKTIVVTDGANEIRYYSDKEQYTYYPTSVKNVIDTTAAGDSFNGSFIAKLLSNESIEKSIDFAAKVAAKVIQTKGTIVPEKEYAKIS